MKILILGAGGMIGHKMYQELSRNFPETYACFHQSLSAYKEFKIFNPDRVIENIDVIDFDQVEKMLKQVKPDVILNCVGITLRKPKIVDLEYCLEVNSLFPHRLKTWGLQNKARLIHFSTDCVFDGALGAYTEDSLPSAKDIYGRTKYLGEVTASNSLTLRGSMIGRELHGKTELLEWCVAQKGKSIKGYSHAIYSGVTTQTMAGLVALILKDHGALTGLYQVSSEPISKFQLLQKVNAAFELDLSIAEDPSYASRKDLVSAKLSRDVGFICPSWDKMIAQIASDKTLYDRIG